MDLEPGTRVDRYTIEGRLGEGGMAVVYKVRHTQLGSLHALKVLSLPMPSVRDRLIQEGRLQASLRHVNVLSVTDIIDVEGAPGLIMEFVDGPNLEVLLARYRPGLAEAEALAMGIISGVSCAHKLGLIHRDLKPANVLISVTDAGPVPKVADFGLARLLAGEPGGMRRTRSGQTMGTPSYMAPEQIRDAKGVGPAADIFSLGAILYDLVCGQQAFPGEDILTVFNAITSGNYISPRVAAPDLPDRVVEAIQGALQVDVARRYPDCEALLAAWRADGGRISVVPRKVPWTAGLLSNLAVPAGDTPLDLPRQISSQTFDSRGIDPVESDPNVVRVGTTSRVNTQVILLTDVVDSTRIAEALGDARMAEVWTAHDRGARDLLARWHGREIDRTDGFLILFEAVPDAVAFAGAYHASLRKLSTDFKVEVRARVGVHVADLILLENTRADVALGAKPVEVEGIAKPLAARVMSVASGGQTLITGTAREAMRSSTLRVESHGHWRMKGISEPIELFEVGDAHSPFTPPPDSAKVYRVVKQGDLWAPRRDVRRVLSAEADTFIGRSVDLQALAAIFDKGARLVTLLGTGGAGKTRLAQRFAWTWIGDFPGGVYFCNLAEARDLNGIASAVARGLDVPLGSEDPVVQLGHAIAGRGECLLILDNFEQVTQYAMATIGRWFDRAPETTFIVTSRERLSVAGEQVLALAPLHEREAVALFEARARTQQPGFSVSPANRGDVTAIVQTLDGLPLAIELAAARIRILSPAQLRERLKERFKVLAGVRTSSVRQGTLKAAIDWSWDLLSPWEQSALAQLSAFEGGFTLPAAECVVDVSEWSEAPFAMDIVQALADKSLLRVETDRPGIDEPWFGMYRSIQEYTAEKLHVPANDGPAGEVATWRRHGEHFASFGQEDAITALDMHEGVGRRRALVAEIGNLSAACRRAIAREDGPVASAACRAAWVVFALRGPATEAVALSEAVLRMGSLEPGDRARVRRVAGLALRMSGKAAAARLQIEGALELYRSIGDNNGEAVVLGNLGLIAMEQGRTPEAVVLQEAALAIHSEAGDRTGAGVALGNLGILSRRKGQPAQAREQYLRALAIHREVGNRVNEGVVLGNLANLLFDQQRLEEAREENDAALAIHREVGHRRGEGVVLGNLGELLAGLGRIDEARASYEAALTIHREIGNRRLEGVTLAHVAMLAAEQGNLVEARTQLGAAEAILRAVGDQLELGKVLCRQGTLYLRTGERAEATAAVSAAEEIAATVGASPTSDLGRLLERVREALSAANRRE